MSVETRWWWIRHAPVNANVIYGQLDLPCESSDNVAFEGLARLLPAGSVLVTSDLQRTVQTAEAISRAGLNLPEPIREIELREQHFGDWQGLNSAEIADARNAVSHRYWIAPASEQAPNGESFAEVSTRVGKAVARITTEHAGRDIVCVGHNGTILAALALALDLNLESVLAVSVDNLSVTRLDHVSGADSHSWGVKMVNHWPGSLAIGH